MLRRLINAHLLLLIIVLIAGCSREPKVLKSFRFTASGGQTAFIQSKQHFHVEYDSLAMGVFIKSIESVAQTKTSYWLLYVNGQSATTSADKFIPAEGDTIEWRLVSSY